MNYEEAKTMQKDLQTKRDDYQKEFEEKQKEVEKAKKSKKEEKEIKELIAKMEEELRPKQEAIMRHEFEVQKTLLAKILDTANAVAKEYGIDVVLDKRVVYAGGFDLTDFVLEKIGK